MKKISLLLVLVLCMLLAFSGCSEEAGDRPDDSAGRDSPIEDYLAEENAGFLASEEVPVSLIYVFMGVEVREYEVTDTQMITDVREAIRSIRVQGPTDLSATDYDEIFIFHTADGKKYSFSFNAGNLSVGDSNYIISNDKALWRLAKEIEELANYYENDDYE